MNMQKNPWFGKKRPVVKKDFIAFTLATSLLAVSVYTAVTLMAAPENQLKGSPEGGGGQSGTTLTAEKSVDGHWENEFRWEIDKSVDKEKLELFEGDSGPVQYTINVIKDSGKQSQWLDGQICVTNGGALPTENLMIMDYVTIPPSKTPVATLEVDVSSNPVLDPGEEGCYDYRIDLTSAVPGTEYKNTADITITNHSGHLGENFGSGPSATTVFPAEATLLHDTITVEDTNGQTFPFEGSGSTSYEKTYACNDDRGRQENTATIIYNDDNSKGPFDTVTVEVSCYKLDLTPGGGAVGKPQYKRTYQWSIEKSADQTNLTLSEGQTFPVNYNVTVHNTDYVDSDWSFIDSVKITNPAPIPITLNSVSGLLTPDNVVADPDCGGVTFPYVLPAGEALSCTYALNLPDASTRLYTVTVVVQNVPSGTTDFSFESTIDFADAIVTEVDKSVNIEDSLGGTLGLATVGEVLPKVFAYTKDVGPYSACGDYTVNNVATLTTNTTLSEQSANWTVNVRVPCAGCTLTIGYWKNHAGFGPQADALSQYLPVLLGNAGGAKTVNVTTAAQAVNLLMMSGEPSNGINKLYAQLLAAKLNIANGASATAIQSTITAADAFLATKNASNWSTLSKADRVKVLNWMTALDNYNNGYTGPGHCSETAV